MSGLEIIFCLLLFIILAPLATLVGIALCAKVVAWFFGTVYKDKISQAIENFFEAVGKQLDKKDAEELSEQVKEALDKVKKEKK